MTPTPYYERRFQILDKIDIFLKLAVKKFDYIFEELLNLRILVG